MAKGKKTGGRNFPRGNRGRPKGAKDKVPRSLKGNLRAVLDEIVQVEEPLIYQRLVGMLKSRRDFFRAADFLAKYTIDKNLNVKFDYSKLTDAELQQLRDLLARSQSV